MNNIDQLIIKATEIFTNIFQEITHLTDNIPISEISGNLLSLIKAFINFIIIVLEAVIKILKLFVH